MHLHRFACIFACEGMTKSDATIKEFAEHMNHTVRSSDEDEEDAMASEDDNKDDDMTMGATPDSRRGSEQIVLYLNLFSAGGIMKHTHRSFDVPQRISWEGMGPAGRFMRRHSPKGPAGSMRGALCCEGGSIPQAWSAREAPQ
jgi:hypothetical protein